MDSTAINLSDLFAKIGMLTVENEVLLRENALLRAELALHQAEPEHSDEVVTSEGKG